MSNSTQATELADDAVILDVRRQDEWDAGHAPTAVHIPFDDLQDRLAELPETNGPLPVVCRGGGRSSRATKWLNDNGYEAVNVTGGMKAWHAADKPMHGTGDAEPKVI